MLFDDMEFGFYDKSEQSAHRAFELYEDGQMAQALAELDTALEVNPASSSLHFNKALTLDSMNRFSDAVDEYETALQLSPNDLEILNALAVDYTRTGQYDRAIQSFEYIQSLDPKFEPCYCNRIITYTEMGQYELAEQMFYLAQQIEPDCALCYYNIGNSLFARGQRGKAIRCWRRTAELEPSHPQINYRIAQAYWAEGEHTAAREHFLSELRVNPGDIEVIEDFGLFLLELGEVESAKEKFNRILELKPGHALALFYLGEIAFDSGCYDKAAALYTEAAQKDQKLPGPRYRLAQCAMMKTEKSQAGSYLAAELALDIEDANTLVSMASMFLTLDDVDRGINCLLRALNMDKGNAEAYYYLGLAHISKIRLETAEEFFLQSLDINPRHVGALKASAHVNVAMGRPDIAAVRIAQARALSPNDRELVAFARRLQLSKIPRRVTGWLCRLNPRRLFQRALR